jgi:subtilisin family serine protease
MNAKPEVMPLLIELRPSPKLESAAFAAEASTTAAAPLDTTAVPKLPGLKLDTTYAPVALPGHKTREHSGNRFDLEAAFNLDLAPENSTYLVRGEVVADKAEEFVKQAKKNPAVVGVFADVPIAPIVACPGSPAIGTDADVERVLSVPAMRRCGMDGTGVLVAVVDTGINLQHLQARGKNPITDPARSWTWNPAVLPFQSPADHGTMCAYDVLIAAPRAALLDVALLHSTTFPTLLSDAVRAFRHLLTLLTSSPTPLSLVVTNSWGKFPVHRDFPMGHPSNYSHNPAHPFNVIVASLERAGADILFAAGNCGVTCPDGRCVNPDTGATVTANTIVGANSHPAVLTVGGVDVTNALAGYSSQGPGALTHDKPDLCGYTHFHGSGVYPADGGTSAATPVVAGVLAAVRCRLPRNPANPATSPASIRALLRSTARDLGSVGYDLAFGHGVVNGSALVARLCRPIIPLSFCRRYPRLCQLLREPRIRLKIPLPDPIRPPRPGLDPLPPGFGATEAGEEDELIAALQADLEAGEEPVESGPEDVIRRIPRWLYCKLFPRRCWPLPDICERFPEICRGIPRERFPIIRDPGPIQPGFAAEEMEPQDDDTLALIAFLAGYKEASQASPPAAAKKSGCGCGYGGH